MKPDRFVISDHTAGKPDAGVGAWAVTGEGGGEGASFHESGGAVSDSLRRIAVAGRLMLISGSFAAVGGASASKFLWQ